MNAELIGFIIPKRVNNLNDLTDIRMQAKRYAKETGGRIRLRGRHSDRKSVLGAYWRKHSQNDIRLIDAERIAVYKYIDDKR